MKSDSSKNLGDGTVATVAMVVDYKGMRCIILRMAPKGRANKGLIELLITSHKVSVMANPADCKLWNQ